MAYSGAITMCSGNMTYPNANSMASYLTVAVALLVILGILLNWKGKKTRWALGLASLGICMMYLGQFYFISITNYYLGVGLLFFGIWFNGSFYYFYHKFLRAFKKYTTTLRYDRGKL